MNSKKIVTIIVIVVLCIAGYKMINSGGGIGLEKSLIATLPEEITSCYCVDNNGEYILNMLEVKKLTIDRQTTDGNYKSADCTIEMEGEDIKKTAYVNLSCIKYDDGSWQVNGWTRLSEPTVVPKYKPAEAIAIAAIEDELGFKNISKVNEEVDLDAGYVIYFYSVADVYEYVKFEGGGVCCSFSYYEGTRYNEHDNELYSYYWASATENNTEMVWDVLGTWQLEFSYLGEAPYCTIDIELVDDTQETSGVSYLSIPQYEGRNFTGQYDTYKGTASCTFSGDSPKDAKCIITGAVNPYKPYIEITANGIEKKYFHDGSGAGRNREVSQSIKRK